MSIVQLPYCQLVDMAVPLLRAEHDVLGEAVAMHGLVRELGGMVGWNDGEANGEAYSE